MEVHPADAAELNLVDHGLARVITPLGDSLFRVAISQGQRRGEVFTPIHWTDRQSSGGRTGLLARAAVDPVSGQPGFKQTPARVEPFVADWHGFMVARTLPTRIAAAYSTRVRVGAGWLLELAGTRDPVHLAASLLPEGERLESLDTARGVRRAVVLGGEGLRAALFLTRSGPLPSRDWIIAQLDECQATPLELIAGKPAQPAPDRGAIVCVCFDVGAQTIRAAAESGAATVEAVGQATCAGTNCGSCRPAIAEILKGTEMCAAKEAA